jgi:TonB-linked SusC/RagA family outer membrane protein
VQQVFTSDSNQQFSKLKLTIMKKRAILKRLRLIGLSVCFLFSFFLSKAQTTISGKITGEGGTGLSGVTITVKGTDVATVSSTEGNYSIQTSPNSVLIFSYVGYGTQEVPVKGNPVINVSLTNSQGVLDSVVVVGYGTQSRRKVTGSIASIATKQLEDQPVGQIAQKLQGRIAGVQVNQASGAPGGGMFFRIRGAASINGGNDPLFVVDGAPIVGGINNINPNEIENISVLKGASAAALYGSRAANGVVLITTKRAQRGDTRIELIINTGVAEVPKRGRPDLMNAKEFLTFQKEYFEDKALYEGYTGGIPELYQNPEGWTGPDTDWLEELTDPAFRQNYSLTVSAGGEKFNSSNTIGYYDEKGVVINSGYKRFSLRSNNEFKANRYIRMGFNIAPSYQMGNHDGSILDYRGSSSTDGLFSNLYAALLAPPILSPHETNPDGSKKLTLTGPGLFTQPNWVTVFNETIETSKTVRLLANAFGEVNFLRNFKFKTAVSTDLQSGNYRVFYPSNTGVIFAPPPTQPTGIYTNATYTSWLTENTLNYNKTFSKDHTVDALFGYSAQKFRQEIVRLTGFGFPDDEVSWIDAASLRGINLNFPIPASSNNNSSEWALLSMFGRLNYDYKGKYLLSASIRRDGSSRFGADNRWGVFPAVSAGWIISQENFVQNWNALSFLKLRAEYGTSGNFNIGNYSHYGNIASTNYVFGGALAPGRSGTSIGNSALTWETTKGFDIGVDVGLFRDRVNVVMDYYNKTTSNMLFQVDIPRGTGFPNIPSNIGEFKFTGFEFAVATKNLVGKLKWESSFNISFNKNKVLALGTNNEPLRGIDFEDRFRNMWRSAVGQPIGQWYGYVFDGIYESQRELDTEPKYVSSYVGGVKYKDVNNDGIIDVNDQTFIGNPNPKFIYGITNNLSYKNLDLNFVLSGAGPHQVFYGLYEWSLLNFGLFNLERGQKDRFRSEQNPGKGLFPSTLAGQNSGGGFSTRYFHNAAYLAIRNITLGYTLPFRSKAFSSLRLYGSIQNPYIFTHYKGMNPEASSNGLNGTAQGADFAPYPVPRVTSLGLNVNF